MAKGNIQADPGPSDEGPTFTREELAEAFPLDDPLPGAYELHLPADDVTTAVGVRSLP